MIVTDTLDDAPVGYVFAPTTNLTFTPVDTNKTYAITVARYISAVQLSVVISLFKATKQNKNVSLKWLTNTEINTSYFNIQRRTNAKEFTTIGTVYAKGASEYIYRDDKSVNTHICFYRLEIVDKDGIKTYSDIIDIVSNNERLIIAPNPAKDIVTIKGTDVKQIIVVDFKGRIVIAKAVNSGNNINVPLGNLSKGTYVIKAIMNNGEMKTEKLMVE